MEEPSGVHSFLEKNLLIEDEGLFNGGNALIEDNVPRNDSQRRYKKRPENMKQSRNYHARNPGPNYSQFKKPEYVDTKGREYKLASGPVVDRLVRSGTVTNPEFSEPDLRNEQQLGTQVFWIRIPIYLRGTVPFPDPEDEGISLFHVATQVSAGGFTNGVFLEGKNKTGYVILNRFETYGQVADPSQYSHLVDEDKKIKRRKTLF